jgi:hypothetical protein
VSELEIDYLEPGAGPGITELPEVLDAPPAGERIAGAPDPGLPGWELEHIEQFLKGTGAGIHLLIGQDERDWLMTKADLERMAPPLTRIANRWEPALRLSPLADPLLFTYGAVLYVWRNALEMQRRKKDLAAAAPEDAGAHYEYPDDADGDADVGEEQSGAPRSAYFPESPRARRSI